MASDTRHRDWLLRLTLVEGVGPIIGRRLIEAFGSPAGAFDATPGDLETVRGIGATKARAIFRSLHESAELLEKELALAERSGVRIVALGDAGYPPLLAQIPDAPLVLYSRGEPPAQDADYAVAIVGSRRCTAYGVEQAERFASALGEAGLVIVSGGARGVDSAAHRASIRVGARTAAVLGCGLSHCYPPENAELFDQIVSAGGCILSELPLDTPPAPDNFPARNRIIAGMSLGCVVIEAPIGSGALITARQASEEYGREVFAVPGRVDSKASEGSNDLIRAGGAALITRPADVIELLESGARRQHEGTLPAWLEGVTGRTPAIEVVGAGRGAAPKLTEVSLTEPQRAIVAAIASEPLTIDALCRATGLDAGVILAETTLLEVRRVVHRDAAGRLSPQTR